MGKPVFETLAAINCNEHTEIKKSEYTDKNGNKRTLELTYLSWAWAWWHVKKEFPDAFYTVYETPEGRPYFDDGRTAWVKTGVTINGLEHIEYLPIMDHANRSIPADRLTSFDMNKAIQRSLTKACARHGLGLYIYAGEDLPDALDDEAREQVAAEVKKAPAAKKTAATERERWIKAIATRAVNQQGVTAEAAYKAKYNPSPEEWQAVLDEVFNYQLENDIH